MHIWVSPSGLGSSCWAGFSYSFTFFLNKSQFNVYIYAALNDSLFMKFAYLLLLIPMATTCGSNKKFPEKMPADFKVEYHLDGGMANMNRTIVLKNGECIDEGREDGGADYAYKFTLTDTKELESLYADLKKLNAFALESKDQGTINDRGGESVTYTLNGKTYSVNNSQSHFIAKEHAEAFGSSLALIIGFAQKYRTTGLLEESMNPEDKNLTENIDTTSTQEMSPPVVGSNAPQTSLGSDEALLVEKNTGIPAKMPNDFKLKYEMSGGITGAYRTILLQYGSSTDEGKNAGESKYSKAFMNKSLKDFENLYNDLYKINAFLLKYTSKGNVADRGGESIKFTINKKEFVVSDKDNNFIKSSDKAAFKKAVALILGYVDTHE
jgi:hypothetical protein